MIKYFTLIISLTLLNSSLQAQTKVSNADDFIIGADLSLVKQIIDNGGIYYIEDQPVDVIDAFKERQYNYARLRLFHSPNGIDGVVNSLDYTIELAKNIKSKGLKLLLDFHYSDTWADPSQQNKPVAWQELDFNTLADSIYQYSKNVLDRFYLEGIVPDMVQTGNEIHHGFLWPEGGTWNNDQPNYKNFSTLLKSAINGVHTSNGGNNIPIMLHAASGGSISESTAFMDSLLKYDVEFDVLGLSYYLCWHGTLTDLENNISYLSSNYNHKIVVVETNYQSDGTSPDYCVLNQDEIPFPYTEQGQYDYLQSLYAILKKYNHLQGLFYWGGELIYADDIGGSWSSLFHWQGNALKALDAFDDLTSIEKHETITDNPIIYIPETNKLIIKYTLDANVNYTLTIFDILGKQIRKYDLNQRNQILELGSQLSGIYLIRFTGNNRIIQSKIKYLN